MAIKVVVKTRFRVNGQDYESVEDMPSDARQACERAMSSLPEVVSRSSGFFATGVLSRSRISMLLFLVGGLLVSWALASVLISR